MLRIVAWTTAATVAAGPGLGAPPPPAIEAVTVERFAQAIPALLAGKGDVIVGIIDTEERRRQIDFTAEVIPACHLAVTHPPASAVESVAKLRTRRVGLLAETSWAAAARDAGVPASNTESFDDFDRLMEALAGGEIEATVMSVTDYTLASRRMPELQAGVFLGPPVRQAWGVRKDDDELERELDEYLGNVRSAGTWSRLVVKYFGEKALAVLGRAGKR